MTARLYSRRRFIQITAGLGAASLLPGLGRAASCGHYWQGIALGADASLDIRHPDPDIAAAVARRCIDEVHRLESLFSLYRPDSSLAVLNRQRVLQDPSADFLALLARSREFSRLTDGVFDVTVQPLWQAYAELHAAPDTPDAQERRARLEAALRHVDWRALVLDTRQVRLARPGMAVTLNGIAQGYITDRVTALLARHGIHHALVNMGEIFALNPTPSATGDRAWQVGIEDARRPGRALARLPLRNRAIATSGAYGTPFGSQGEDNHLLDPRDGSTSTRYRSVSVVADDATTADALSTAFSLMPEKAIAALAGRMGVQVYVQAAGEAGLRRI